MSSLIYQMGADHNRNMEALHIAIISYLSHVRKLERNSKLVQEIYMLSQRQQDLCQYRQS